MKDYSDSTQTDSIKKEILSRVAQMPTEKPYGVKPIANLLSKSTLLTKVPQQNSAKELTAIKLFNATREM